MSEKMSFGLGATLYSFNIDYYTHKRTLEDCMEALASLGPSQGVEVVAPMMDRGYPNVSPEFERRFKNALEKYELVPTCYSGYADPQRVTGRYSTEEEQLEYLLCQLNAAKQLGFPVLRVQPCRRLLDLAPYAEKAGVKVTYEIHAPMQVEDHPLVRQIVELGNPWLGFVPDCGTFCRAPSDVYFKRFASQGVPQEVADCILELWHKKVSMDEMRREAKKLVDNELVDLMVTEAMEYFGHSDPAAMIPVMDFIPHMHGKFFYVDENGSESAVRLQEVVAALKKGGFKGYISSEYEGHHWYADTDALEQLRRHQAAIRKYCEEA